MRMRVKQQKKWWKDVSVEWSLGRNACLGVIVFVAATKNMQAGNILAGLERLTRPLAADRRRHATLSLEPMRKVMRWKEHSGLYALDRHVERRGPF